MAHRSGSGSGVGSGDGGLLSPHTARKARLSDIRLNEGGRDSGVGLGLGLRLGLDIYVLLGLGLGSGLGLGPGLICRRAGTGVSRTMFSDYCEV